VVRAVTLEATPDEAEELVQARSQGSIQLALRNVLDNDVVQAPPAAKPKVKVRAPTKPAKPKRYITIIRGTSVSQVRQNEINR
jgi:pilus assembly protein CpaB